MITAFSSAKSHRLKKTSYQAQIAKSSVEYRQKRKGQSLADRPFGILDRITGRGDKIRTCDPLYPKQVRYQAAPLPDAAKRIGSVPTLCK